MKIIANCSLCNERSLHVIGEGEIQTQQCINCGYVTAEKFKYNSKEEHLIENLKVFKELTEDMKNWSVRANNYIWIPTMMTLPFGMLYPQNNEDGVMEWVLAKLIEIPKEEQKNYPQEDGDGFYNNRFDTESLLKFDSFLEGMSFLNEQAKKEGIVKEDDSTLPNLEIDNG